MGIGSIRRIVAVAALAFAASLSMAADSCGNACKGNWVTAWGTAQQLMKPERAIPAAVTPPERVVAQTVRMVARPTLTGTAVRVALSNSFGFAPVRVDAAHIGVHDAAGAVRAGSDRALSFGGRAWVVIPPGAQVYSDPMVYDVKAQQDLAISLFLDADSGPTTAHPIGLRTAWLAPGNQVAAAQLQQAKPFQSYLWLAGIDVRAAPDAAAIVAFGDSITDGFSTTPDADLSWPSILARRLAAQRNQPPRAVINMGISGNRLLREGAGSSGLARFDRDVLSRPGVRSVLVLLGINDIGFSAIAGLPASEKATAEDIITGYRMLIGRARLHGLTIIGGTLMAFEGVPTFSEEGERMRQQVNAWIRTSGEFDAVIDFDAATRDPATPGKLRREFDSGDHIHPNDAGNKAMADAIDLKLFR